MRNTPEYYLRLEEHGMISKEECKKRLSEYFEAHPKELEELQQQYDTIKKNNT